MDIDKLDDKKQKHELTFEKYISNPSGNKGNLFLNMAMVRDNLSEKFDKLYREHSKRFQLNVYKKDKGYILYVKVPSSKYDLTYDVVFELYDINKDDTKPLDKISLNKCKFRVFSNCPSFVFTYAYIFSTRGLLIEELKKKYDKNVLKRQPYEKNYFQIIAMEKSIYFAITYLLMEATTLEEIDNMVERGNPFGLIASDQGKLLEYQNLQKKEREEKAKEKKKEHKVIVKRVESPSNKKSGTKSTGKKISNKKVAPKSKIKGKSKIK